MAELLASDSFRRLYILAMILLAFIPMWRSRNLILFILPRTLLPHAKKFRRFGFQGSIDLIEARRSLVEALKSTEDPNIARSKLVSLLKRNTDSLSCSTLAAVNAIQRCQKNHLLTHGLIPTAPVLHSRLSESLLSFRFWGPFQAKLGLFGTFLGVSAGLTIMSAGIKNVQHETSPSAQTTASSADSGDASKRAALVIQDVIASCATAFDTSVIGLLFAIAFSLADRKCSKITLRVVDPVATKLDHFASDWALSDTDSLDKSLDTLRSIVDNLHSAAIENGQNSQLLINGFLMHLDSAFGRFREEMTQAVQKAMDARYTEHLNSVAIVDSGVANLISTLKEMRHLNGNHNGKDHDREAVASHLIRENDKSPLS